MDSCSKGSIPLQVDQPYLQCVEQADRPALRRCANYKPNIWKYDLLQSLASEYDEEKYRRQFQRLKEDVLVMFVETAGSLPELELVSNIGKLGLASLFEVEIKKALDNAMLSTKINNCYYCMEEDLYATALCFRLLRQHGYDVSQGMFIRFMDNTGNLMHSTHSNVKGMLEFFEASHLALEDEDILNGAKTFCTQKLKDMISSNLDSRFAMQVAEALDVPLHRKVEWYNVRRHVELLEQEGNTNTGLIKLAKLNFNFSQAVHQKDIKELSRWWKNLGISESLSFTRSRIVESYLWAMGVAFEPQHGSFRKWLAKAIKLVIIIDDVYDIYGSLEELEIFTRAVDRWELEGVKNLPDCMKMCFQALYDTTCEVASEIQKEKGWNSVLHHLHKVWADFCKALLVEARWDNEGYTPSFQEYLENGWISSSGAVLSLHAFFSVKCDVQEEMIVDFLKNSHELVRCTSLIIRLCNDQGTSAAELERGDVPSSILCFMREANVSEEVARKHIRNIITSTWKKINNECSTQSPLLQQFVKFTANTSRVAHFIYHKGDGFGVQDRETRDQVLSLLMEPLPLDS